MTPEQVLATRPRVLTQAQREFYFSEGYILQDNSAIWVMYVAIAAKLALKPSGKESV